jgi:hypothetical protein
MERQLQIKLTHYLSVRPVPKPFRIGIDRGGNHSVYIARCGELVGWGIGA